MKKYYAAIDLKSFYASVECVERGLNPMTTNLVVADWTRTDGTICLAVSSALKALGLPGRCRLFEVKAKAREYFLETGKELEYIVAPPRMRKYLEMSRKIYAKVYRKFVAEEDIFPYSVDEVFLDISSYLKFSGARFSEQTSEEFVSEIILAILGETGLVATGGVGTNLYLAKVAMDILAKHTEPNESGVRVALLDEQSYRRKLWGYKPLTDFWRVGPGTARKLAQFNIFCMGDIARVAIRDEEFFYKLFGVDAELLIDHAFGVEPVGIKEIKEYRPEKICLSRGQVLGCAVEIGVGRLITSEMIDVLATEMVGRNFETKLVTLDLIYEGGAKSRGSTHPLNKYGEPCYSASVQKITERTRELYDRIVEPGRKVKRIYVSVGELEKVGTGRRRERARQMSLLESADKVASEEEQEMRSVDLTRAVLEIQKKYGRNAILKAMNFEEGATQRQRNEMIGGHNAGK